MICLYIEDISLIYQMIPCLQGAVNQDPTVGDKSWKFLNKGKI